ncbi:ABC transporter permease [Nocardioides sp. SYSU DS0663]|uniref:ABC transporter permease n=1 Tax=Nocardioides sp. SYSU DS0663 TaxID=3416445 RepID=UPI003F4B0DDA
MLLLLGLLGPVAVTVVVAIQENGPLGVVTEPLSSDLVLDSIWKTLYLSLAVTVATWICAVLFTLAVAMSRPIVGKTLFGILFLTFWISLLVRTYGWALTLQPNGALDVIGQRLGLTDEGFGLFQTMPGLLPPMVHVMLPYMVLPIYAAIQSLDPAQVRAARSLGGSELFTLRKLILPSLKSGSWAGALLVFILSLGFYVTPAFLGGPGTQVLAMVIGLQFGRLENLGLTAALGTLLLVAVLGMYVVADRLFKISQQWDRA